jgi:hypothetical protein
MTDTHTGSIKSTIADGKDILAAAIKWRNLYKEAEANVMMMSLVEADAIWNELDDASAAFLALLDTRTEVNN